MIKNFRHRGLKELFEKGRTARIDKQFHARLANAMELLDGATDLRVLDGPGYNLHPLKQFKPWKWSMWISGSWRLTFEWDKGDAYRVDFEQYH